MTRSVVRLGSFALASLALIAGLVGVGWIDDPSAADGSAYIVVSDTTIPNGGCAFVPYSYSVTPPQDYPDVSVVVRSFDANGAVQAHDTKPGSSGAARLEMCYAPAPATYSIVMTVTACNSQASTCQPDYDAPRVYFQITPASPPPPPDPPKLKVKVKVVNENRRVVDFKVHTYLDDGEHHTNVVARLRLQLNYHYSRRWVTVDQARTFRTGRYTFRKYRPGDILELRVEATAKGQLKTSHVFDTY